MYRLVQDVFLQTRYSEDKTILQIIFEVAAQIVHFFFSSKYLSATSSPEQDRPDNKRHDDDVYYLVHAMRLAELYWESLKNKKPLIVPEKLLIVLSHITHERRWDPRMDESATRYAMLCNIIAEKYSQQGDSTRSEEFLVKALEVPEHLRDRQDLRLSKFLERKCLVM
jgi:hypothetical protein